MNLSVFQYSIFYLGEAGRVRPFNWSISFWQKPTHFLNPMHPVLCRCDFRCVPSENLPIIAVSYLYSENTSAWENQSVSQYSCSVVSDSLRPHGLQHTRLPCPSPTPRASSDSCPSNQWCHPTSSSSVIPFSSHQISASSPPQLLSRTALIINNK